MALDFPDIPIAKSRFGLKRVQASFESSFSRKVTTQAHGGGVTDRWEGIYTTPALSLAQCRTMKAFVSALKGQIGTFKAYNPDKRRPSTFVGTDLKADSTGKTSDTTSITADSDDFPGIGQVDGGGQTGTLLNTKAWPANATVMKAGDFFQIGAQLFAATADIVSDGTGKAAVNLEPAIRTSPADAAEIITENPIMIARLSLPFIAIEAGPTHASPVSMPFEEVL